MIQVQNLVKKYGDFTAVNDISFTVEAGEIFAFLGPNGAGKTTTIKMLTTLLTPTSGKIQLDGLDPTVHKNEARQKIRDRVPGSQPRQRTDRLREHGIARRSLSCSAQGASRAHRRLAEAVRALGSPGRHCQEVLRRHEAPPRNRPRISAHAEDSVSRRADAGS